VLERAVELGKANLSEDDPDVLVTAFQLATLLRQADDPAAARRVLEEAYAAGQWRLGDTDSLVLQISHDIGAVAEELGNRHEARKAFGRVADLGPATLGADHPAVARARAYLGQSPDSVRLDSPFPPAAFPAPTSAPNPPTAAFAPVPNGVPRPVPAAPQEGTTDFVPVAVPPPPEAATTVFGPVPGSSLPAESTTAFGSVPAEPPQPTTAFVPVVGSSSPAGSATASGQPAASTVWAEPTTAFTPVAQGLAGAPLGSVQPPPAATPVWNPPGPDRRPPPAEAEASSPRPAYDAIDELTVIQPMVVYRADLPVQGRPDQARPDQARPDQARPDQARPDQARPDQVRSDQVRSDQVRSDQVRSDQVRSDQVRSDQARSDRHARRQTGPDRALPWYGPTGSGGVASVPDRTGAGADGRHPPGVYGAPGQGVEPGFGGGAGFGAAGLPVPAQRVAPGSWTPPARAGYPVAARPVVGSPGGDVAFRGGEVAYRRKGLGVFAAVAAVFAAVVAVAALVFVLVYRVNDRSGESNVPTLAGPAPSDVKLTDRGSEIQITWTDPSAGSVSFLVAMGHPGEQLKPISTLGPGQTSYRTGGLNPGLNYCFAVIAVYRSDKFSTSPQACTSRVVKSPAVSTSK